jgi:hypothetical protein
MSELPTRRGGATSRRIPNVWSREHLPVGGRFSESEGRFCVSTTTPVPRLSAF